MACNCGSKKAAKVTYTVTKPNGERQAFSTEVEAASAAKRTGGTYRASA